MRSTDKVVIGAVAAPHGVRGALRVHPLTDRPERFLDMKRLNLDLPGGETRSFPVRSILSVDRGILVELEGVEDRDQAERLRGARIWVAPEERFELEEGEYWIDDLIGMTLREADSGRALGILEEVFRTGANDCYLVRTPEGELRYLPAIRDVVRSVDPAAREIRVVLIEGLWD